MTEGAKKTVRSLRLRTLVAVVFSALVVFIFVRLFVGVRRFDRVSDEVHERIAQDRQVEDAIERVTSDLADSETGLRGWLLTRDRRFLEPYERASLRREQSLNDLVALESSDPRSKATVERIATRAREWYRSVGDPGVAADSKPVEPDAQLSLQLFGKSRMDLIRADLGELRGDLDVRRAGEEVALEEYRQDLVGNTYLSSSILAFLTIAAGLFILRRVDRPLGVLVDYVQNRAWEQPDRKPLIVTGIREIEVLAELMEAAAERGNTENARAAQLRELTGKLVEGGDVDQLADSVAEWTASQMSAVGAVIWIVDDDRLRLAACHGVDRASVEKAGAAKAEKVRAAGKMRRFDNLSQGRVVRSAMVDVQPRSLVLLPIRGRATVVGVLELAGDRLGDVGMLGDALDRIGLALETSMASSRIKSLGTALAAANDELRAQNEELRAQEEELRSQSDELVAKQRDLASSNEALEKGSRHKSEFLSDMSHELRTPLNAVIGFSELLLGDTYGQLAEPQRERVNDIATAGRQLLALVNDILDLSRIEAGRVELKIAAIDIRSSMDEAVALLQPIADKKKVKVEAILPQEALTVSADPDRVRQVMVNLLSNAIKFTPAGGSVEIEANQEDAMVRIEVRDTGIGISPDDARKLFSPFTQLEGGVNAGGAGLGLSISKRLVGLMSGEIGVDSAVGRGSIFYFTLPRPAETSDAPKPTRSSLEPKKWASKRRILVVEDDPKQIHAIEELLARAGHDVHAATGPASAMTDVDQFTPELVVIDLGLPNGAGFKLVDELAVRRKSASKKLAIVALTSRALSAEERASLASSVDLVAEKGVMTGAGFLDAVAALLEQSAPRKKSKVLVVDDSAINRSVLRAMLESAGFEVVEADRAKDGIAMAQAAPPQVILMDIRMPDMNGLDATRALMQDPRTLTTPIIAVSAQAMTGDRQLALDAGCVAYVTKPVARQELLSAIGGALQKGGDVA